MDRQIARDLPQPLGETECSHAYNMGLGIKRVNPDRGALGPSAQMRRNGPYGEGWSGKALQQ